jgi:8-amino-3,8-dideoxy-alpha-D-manno-octulosonate transaminase
MVTDDPAIQLWGQGSRLNEISAAVLCEQEKKLDTITARMRGLNHALYVGLDGIAGLRPRRVIDPEGDSGSFVLLIWPDAAICAEMIAATRAAGVRPGPMGQNNIPMSEWGLHLYYNNVSLTNKRGVTSAGRPWNDPANVFAEDYDYGRGTLPQTDALFARSSLMAVPPVMSAETVSQIVQIFECTAAELGL